nr:MAG TPA: hypothetical protein [Caudoviricetes sp.]
MISLTKTLKAMVKTLKRIDNKSFNLYKTKGGK